MPTYDYECSKCGNRFEKFQKMSDRPSASCPDCGADAHRLISTGSGVIFKGAGFYETDYKKKSGSGDDKKCPGPKGDGCNGCSLNDNGKH